MCEGKHVLHTCQPKKEHNKNEVKTHFQGTLGVLWMSGAITHISIARPGGSGLQLSDTHAVRSSDADSGDVTEAYVAQRGAGQ